MIASTKPEAEAILQVDNERVIITEWKFPPGAETGWHQHKYDYIVVPNTNGNLLLETTEAENIARLEVGQSYFRPAGIKHNVVNANDYPFSFVEIELK